MINKKRDIVIKNIYYEYLEKRYKRLGKGNEGLVYKYNNKYAIKIFHNRKYDFENSDTDKEVLKKIEAMFNESDTSFCFPIGFVRNCDGEIKGFYTELVKFHKNMKDFDYLKKYGDFEMILNCIIQADEAIRRAHQKGMIIGDIKYDNIMITKKGVVKLIDTDNFIYGDYKFNIEPARSQWLSHIHKKNTCLIDNDIFVFSLISLFLITNNYLFDSLPSAEKLNNAINNLDVRPEIKEGLDLIFSDSFDKPYFGDVLKLFDNDDFEKIKKKS